MSAELAYWLGNLIAIGFCASILILFFVMVAK